MKSILEKLGLIDKTEPVLILNAPKEAVEALDGDGHLWLCYPKGTSKKYKSDINRTKSWGVFSTYDFEPVSQVAIDENWTAMRFRHIDNIKNMKRKTAATEKGKERINRKN